MPQGRSIILPDDPEWHEPLVMGDAYNDPQSMPPKLAAQHRMRELDTERSVNQQALFPYYDPNFKYASSGVAVAPDPWFKMAQSSGVNNAMTQPMWFSPLHTPQNWQIASRRREIYQWLKTDKAELLTNDFTFKKIYDLEFDGNAIEDTVTGGVLFDHINSENVISGSGQSREPSRIALRQCNEKRSFEFKCHGYWRTDYSSEEHKSLVLDGKAYRKYKKSCSDSDHKGRPIPEKGMLEWKQACDISIEDYLLSPVPDVGTTSIDNSLAWLIGLFLADGTSYKGSGYSVRFTLNKNEYYRQQLEDNLENQNWPVSSVPHNSENGWRVSVTQKDAYNFFAQYVVGKSLQKKLSASTFNLDKETRLHLIGGYFDGDGSFSKEENKLLANCYSKDMADQIFWLLISVGIRASLCRYPLYGDHYEPSAKWCYRVFISQSDVIKLQPYMRSNKVPKDFEPKNQRNLKFFYEEDGVRYFAQPIQSIHEFLFTGTGYDIQIDPDRSFVSGGFVTSNCRFFYENEPKVAAAIDFYSRFPMNGFKLECPSRKVLKFFEHHVIKRLQLNEKFKMISSEYFMLGDVFIHTDVECPVCQSSGIDPDTGEQCNHPGGSFKRLLVLNPDWIEVQQSILADEPAIVMVPDEEMKRIVFYKQPKVIYDRIPDHVKALVLQNKPIPLSNRTTSHIRHMPVPYGTYGSSLIRRLFTTLAYKTKIMTANWIVAERLIIPVRVVKIGSDNRPATSTDIADIQQQLSATANDPNLTIVTHHNFEYEWYGACFDVNTEILTTYGWKRLSEISKDEVVATYNKQTGHMEFQKIVQYHKYDFKSNDKLKMIHFNQRGVDIMVTPEHRMLVERNDKLQMIRSQYVKHGDKFISTVKWKGTIPDTLPHRKSPLNHLSLDEYLQLAGYYISEGGSKRGLSLGLSKDKQIQAAGISQNTDSPYYEAIETLVKKAYPNYLLHKDERKKVPDHTFLINNVEIARYLSSEFGMIAHEKKIPSWIKDLPVEKLQILYDALMADDGDIRDDHCAPRYSYTTTSSQLAGDVSEISLKLGYWPSTSTERTSLINKNRRDVYRVYWYEHRKDRKFEIRRQHIHHEDYNDKVYCVTVPNEYIITRRNGKITVQGNTGKILQVTQEMEYVGKEILDGFMLNQSLLNGEMCLSDDHDVLTIDGYKSIVDVSEMDSICLWDEQTESYVYEKPLDVYKYDDIQDIYEVCNGDKVLFKCSANHKILLKDKDSSYKTITALELHKIGAYADKFPKLYDCNTLLRDGTLAKITEVRKDQYGRSVYCFRTSTGYFVAKHGDTEFVSSNSGYQSAQVGVETLIRRIESWRHSLAEWVEENIFKAVAEMQGFIDEEASNEVGEPVYMYPRIKWNDLQLKDKSQWYDKLMQLYDKQVISTQTLMEEMEMDYDQEVKRQRYEMIQMGPAGAALGGGMGGGMGMSGGMGGALGGELGGIAPGSNMGDGMGMGDMGSGVMGGDMGGDMGGMAPAAASGKVTKKGKGTKQEMDEDQMAATTPMVKLTRIEQAMAGMLSEVVASLGANPRTSIRAQFPVENPKGGKPFLLDFAVPPLKLAVECLHPHTLVPTNKGTMRACDIETTCKLIGRNGNNVDIERIIKHSYDGKMYTIKGCGLPGFDVTHNHPMLVAKPIKTKITRKENGVTRTRYKVMPGPAEFVDTEKVMVGDFLVLPKSKKPGIEFTSIDLQSYNGITHNSHRLSSSVKMDQDLGWLLGIYAAEGCCDPGNRSAIEFSFHLDEKNFQNKVQKILKDKFDLDSVIVENKELHTGVVRTCSTALAKFLTNTFGIHAHNKFAAPWLCETPAEFKIAFLKGYCDGDGCIRQDYQMHRFISSSLRLLLDVQRIALSMGMWGSIVKSRDAGLCDIQGRSCQTKGLWELSISVAGLSKPRYREDELYFYTPVTDITDRPYCGPVVNFETSGKGIANHTYCVSNVVSHNCDGEIWHNQPEQQVDDQERDNLLAQRGWSVLRFDDKAIEESPQAIKQTISAYIQTLMKKPLKHASKNDNGKSIYLFSSREGQLMDCRKNPDKYFSRLKMYQSETFGEDKKGFSIIDYQKQASSEVIKQ